MISNLCLFQLFEIGYAYEMLYQYIFKLAESLFIILIQIFDGLSVILTPTLIG